MAGKPPTLKRTLDEQQRCEVDDHRLHEHAQTAGSDDTDMSIHPSRIADRWGSWWTSAARQRIHPSLVAISQ